MNITCIGSGIFSFAIANLLKENKNNKIKIWSHDEEFVKNITNSKKVSFDDYTMEIPENITLTSSLSDAVDKSDAIFILVSSKYFIDILNELQYENIRSIPIFIGTKGLLDISPYFLSSYAKKVLKSKNISYIAGPNKAQDLLNNKPALISVGTKKKKVFELIKSIMPDFIKIERLKELEIIELASTIKNIYAIGAGMIYQKYPSDSTLLSYSALAYKEMARILYYNFDFEDIEFYSGVGGDFFLTNTMHKSRNFIYGTKRAISSNEGNIYMKKNTVEGYENIDNVVSFLNNKLKKYPILEAIHSILYKNEKTDILYNTCFKKD